MPDRPQAVSRIGWGWLVFGAILLVRSLLDLVVWRVLAPAVPSFISLLDATRPENRLVRRIVDHLVAYKAIEAVFAAVVILVASQFLRLRPWARPALQILCGVVTVYVLAFAAFGAWLWPRLESQRARPTAAEATGSGLVLGLVIVLVILAIAWLLVRMIRRMSSAAVREAFRAQT
jgi:hypothetical protein